MILKRVVVSLFIGLLLTGLAAAQSAGLRSFRQIGGATHELNTDQLVASHPSLSMGTQLKVTNTANGKEVIVTVTGRIPASGTRIVDLSRAASARLEMNPSGSTPVTIEVLRNTEQAAAPEPPPPEPEPVVVAREEPPPPEPEPEPEPVVVAVAEPEPVREEPKAEVAKEEPPPRREDPVPVTIYNTITVETRAPETPAPVAPAPVAVPAPAPVQPIQVFTMPAPQIVKVVPAPVIAVAPYCPPVVPVVSPVYCPPSPPVMLAPVPIKVPVQVLVTPVQTQPQIQPPCPPGYQVQPGYSAPAYRQVQPQPSYGYSQAVPQVSYQAAPQPSYQAVPQASYQAVPQASYQPAPQPSYQPAPAQASPITIYTSPQTSAQNPVTVYTAQTPSAYAAASPVQAQVPVQQAYGAAVIKPRMPDPGSYGVYRVQVGSYTDPQNAQIAAEALARAGLSPAYEQYGQNWRVVLPGISAQQMTTVAQHLGALGIREAWIRQEG